MKKSRNRRRGDRNTKLMIKVSLKHNKLKRINRPRMKMVMARIPPQLKNPETKEVSAEVDEDEVVATDSNLERSEKATKRANPRKEKEMESKGREKNEEMNKKRQLERRRLVKIMMSKKNMKSRSCRRKMKDLSHNSSLRKRDLIIIKSGRGVRGELVEVVVVVETGSIRTVAMKDKVVRDPNIVRSSRPANQLWTNLKIAPITTQKQLVKREKKRRSTIKGRKAQPLLRVELMPVGLTTVVDITIIGKDTETVKVTANTTMPIRRTRNLTVTKVEESTEINGIRIRVMETGVTSSLIRKVAPVIRKALATIKRTMGLVDGTTMTMVLQSTEMVRAITSKGLQGNTSAKTRTSPPKAMKISSSKLGSPTSSSMGTDRATPRMASSTNSLPSHKEASSPRSTRIRVIRKCSRNWKMQPRSSR